MMKSILQMDKVPRHGKNDRVGDRRHEFRQSDLCPLKIETILQRHIITS